MLYTFAQPVRGGYYYIVAKADSMEEATALATDETKNIKHKRRYEEAPLGSPHSGGLVTLSTHAEGTLLLEPDMQERLNQFGVAHRFTPRPLPSPRDRGFLPK